MVEFQDKDERWLDYLYGEMTSTERAEFERSLSADPALQSEVQEFVKLRQAYQKHLPELSVPSALRAKVLQDLGVKRSWWEAWFGAGLLRPVMVGAFAFVLTLGISYGLRDRDQVAPTVAKTAKHQPQRWHWRPEPRLRTGLVSLASYGSSTMPQPYGETSAFEIPEMEKDANMAIAQFVHQQAMRMRARGDFRGASQELAKLIKQYPAYPHTFAAAAQRIDCLFRLGENEVARRELTWLNQQSPFFAQLVGQRWGL